MTYDSIQGNFLLFLHLSHDSTQWGLDPGPKSWCQDLKVGGRAEGSEAGARVWRLESGTVARALGAGARAWRLGPGGWGLGVEVRTWG